MDDIGSLCELRDQYIRVHIQIYVIIFLFMLRDVVGKFNWKGRIYYLVPCLLSFNCAGNTSTE